MSHARDDALLARAELALETLRFREQAALYHAAAQMLQSALRQAQDGNREPLEDWFRQYRNLIDLPLPSLNTLPSLNPGSSLSLPSFSPPSEIANLTEVAPLASPAMKAPVTQSEAAQAPSPWAAMEAALLKRTTSDSLGPILAEATLEPPGEQAMVADPAEDEIAVVSANDNSVVPSKSGESLSGTVALFEIRSEGEDSRRSKIAWWRASHVWISAAVHAIAILALSLIVIQQISQPQVLAIVSATVESEEVLVETPMESPSELEAEPLEAPAIESPLVDPNIPDLPDPTMAEVDLAGPLLSQQRSSQDVSKAIQARPVSPPGKTLAPGAEFFGVKATGNTFVYIVDCSPSMRRDNAFDFAKQEITRSLKSMKPTQRFSILFFGKEVERLEFSPGMPEEFPVPATPENVDKALRWMARCSIQKEGLPPNDALDLAIQMQPDGVFLLFDGDTRVDVPKHLGQSNRSTDILTEGEPRVPIHVVHFFLEEFAPSMQRVAAENLGTYRFIPRPERRAASKR
ncbi:vWA domain-containing protein [Pirellulaceae bacterium SH501]